MIGGYTLRYHPDFGGSRISAHVMIEANPKKNAGIVAGLSQMTAVKTLQTVSGIYDLVTTLETGSTEEMDRVLDAIGAIDGVEKTTTSIVLTTKFSR